MVSALVKGEFHVSSKDKEALMQMDLSQFDAVFQEGYEESGVGKNMSPGLALFRIGRIVLNTTLGRFYYDREDVKRRVRNSEAELYDDIDVPISEHYGLVPRWKRFLFLVTSPVVALVTAGLLVAGVQSLAPPGVVFEIRLAAALLLFLSSGFLWALFYFVFVAGEAFQERDVIMSESIINEVNSKGYDSVLVSCGGEHREGIAEELRSEGWDVREESTESSLGKLFNGIEQVLRAVMSPIETVKRWR